MNQRLLGSIAIISFVILILTKNLYYQCIKIGGNIFLITGLVEIISASLFAIFTFLIFLNLYLYKEWRTKTNVLIAFLPIALLLSLSIGGIKMNENTFQSPVKMKARYEGTMNTSRLFLRENGTFEDFNIGWFAYVHYYEGTWKQNKDTLFLRFKYNQKPNLLDNVLIIKGDNIYKIQADTLVPTYYYFENSGTVNINN